MQYWRQQVTTKKLRAFENMLKIQCDDGNWNYDPYMHGMANGMILAMQHFGDKPQEFLDAPEEWIVDMKNGMYSTKSTTEKS